MHKPVYYTIQCTLYTICTRYTVHCTVYSVQYLVHCIIFTGYGTLYSVPCILYVHCTLYSVQCTIYYHIASSMCTFRCVVYVFCSFYPGDERGYYFVYRLVYLNLITWQFKPYTSSANAFSWINYWCQGYLSYLSHPIVFTLSKLWYAMIFDENRREISRNLVKFTWFIYRRDTFTYIHFDFICWAGI